MAAHSPPPAPSSSHMSYMLNGTHRFTISSYSLMEDSVGPGEHVPSTEFYVGDHRWKLRYYPNGSREGHRSDHVSVFLCLESDSTANVPVLADFSLVGSIPSATEHTRCLSHTFRVPGRGGRCGFEEYARRCDLAASGCLRDDGLVVQCVVRIVSHVLIDEGEMVPIPVPPAELQNDFHSMLEDAEGADVTFKVGGETFRAHKCVLAARSPVFRAELFGPLKEGREAIEIVEMEPEVFKAMLLYVYCDTLPEMGDEVVENIIMAQHLLVAADRYGLERLSRACQDRLSQCLHIDSAADTYALAGQYGFSRLMAAVASFVARQQHGTNCLVGTDGFRRLEEADRAAAEELLREVNAAIERAQDADTEELLRGVNAAMERMQEAAVNLQPVLTKQGLLDLLAHILQCSVRNCQHRNCRGMKLLFLHVAHCKCKVAAPGRCNLTETLWRIARFHASFCNDPESRCKLPRCRDLKEYINKLKKSVSPEEEKR